MSEETNVESIFKQDVKPPFTFNLQLDTMKCDKLFDFIKNIFIKGLVILYGNGNNIDISKVTLNMINKVSEYMLSFGIRVFHKNLDSEEKDFLFRSLLYEIEKTEELKIMVQMDWKTNLVHNINITIDKEHEHKLVEFKNKARKHFIANHFLKMYQPVVLRDYAIIINHKGDESIIYFDYENLKKYK